MFNRLGICCLWFVLSASAPAQVSRSEVTQGVAAYEAVNFRKAADLLTRALTRSDLPVDDRAKALAYLGRANAALGESTSAVKAFVELLRLVPGYAVDADESPRIRTIFEEAKKQVEAEKTSANATAKPSPPVAPPTASAVPSRESELMPTTSRLGTRGIERIESAWPTVAHDVVVSLGGDGFRGKKLFTPNDADTLFHEYLTITWAPLAGLDVTAGQSFSSNKNTVWRPSTVQSMGNPALGVKYSLTLGSEFSVAAATRVLAPTAMQGHGLELGAVSVTGLLAGSWRAASFLGLTLNVGYLMDRSRHLTATKLAPVQRFALGISDTNQAIVGLGAETNWRAGGDVSVGPFVEMTAGFGAHTKRQNNPIRATVGAKVLLLGANRLELSLGSDIALSGKVTREGSHMAGIPPWAVFARVTAHPGNWIASSLSSARATSCVRDADCAAGMTCLAGTCGLVQVEQVIKAPATYRISGRITNKSTNEPIDSARVTVSGYESTPLAVDPKTGAYVSFALPCGEGVVQLTAVAEGYHPEQKVIAKGIDPGVKTADFALQSSTELLTAEVRGSLKNADNGRAIQGMVFFPTLNLKIRTDPHGRFQTTLKSGRYQVLITAPRFVTQKKEIQVRGGDSVILNVDMEAEGK